MLWPEGLDGLYTVTAPTTPKTYCSERGLRSYWLKASCMTAFLTYTEAGLQTPFYLTSLDFVVVKLKHYTLWDERVFHCHSVVHSPLQNTLLKSNPWLARKSILELCEMKWQKTMFHFHFPPKKKKDNNQPINQQTSQLLFNKLKYCHYQKSMTNDTVEDLLDKWTLCPGMSCWTVSGKYKN